MISGTRLLSSFLCYIFSVSDLMEVGKGDGAVSVENMFQQSTFVAACRQMLPFIDEAFRQQGHRNGLPTAVLIFLCEHLHLSHFRVSGLWEEYRSLIYGDDLKEFDHLMCRLSSHRDGVLSLHRLGLGMFIPWSLLHVHFRS